MNWNRPGLELVIANAFSELSAGEQRAAVDRLYFLSGCDELWWYYWQSAQGQRAHEKVALSNLQPAFDEEWRRMKEGGSHDLHASVLGTQVLARSEHVLPVMNWLWQSTIGLPYPVNRERLHFISALYEAEMTAYLAKAVGGEVHTVSVNGSDISSDAALLQAMADALDCSDYTSPYWSRNWSALTDGMRQLSEIFPTDALNIVIRNFDILRLKQLYYALELTGLFLQVAADWDAPSHSGIVGRQWLFSDVVGRPSLHVTFTW